MRDLFAAHAANVVLAIGIWAWVLKWPASFVISQLTPDISIVRLLKLGLLAWSAREFWEFGRGLWFGGRWLQLELQGMHWVKRNDQLYRVIYLRPDGSLRYDRATRQSCLDEEVALRLSRREALPSAGPRLLAYLLIWAAFPLIPMILSREIGFYDWGRSFVAFLYEWDAVGIVMWLWFFFRIVPEAVGLDEAVYRAGAQFCPGAHVRETVAPEKMLETIYAQEIYGKGGFDQANDAARQLSKE
jgi:hypothetical protein